MYHRCVCSFRPVLFAKEAKGEFALINHGCYPVLGCSHLFPPRPCFRFLLLPRSFANLISACMNVSITPRLPFVGRHQRWQSACGGPGRQWRRFPVWFHVPRGCSWVLVVVLLVVVVDPLPSDKCANGPRHTPPLPFQNGPSGDGDPPPTTDVGHHPRNDGVVPCTQKGKLKNWSQNPWGKDPTTWTKQPSPTNPQPHPKGIEGSTMVPREPSSSFREDE